MGTTAQKLEYLGTTKSQLKNMINYGLDDNNKITSSTTFRNYVTSIFNAFLEALRTPDTLFTNLPKVSGSGSVISLNDTANAPMRIELGASELTQASTPTPSSPQDIHTISGSNKVVINGKNLFDKNNPTIIDGIVNGTTGILTAPTNNQKSIVISILPNTTYTISGVERSYSNTGLFSDNTLTIGTSVATLNTGISGGTKTFTTGNNDKWLVFLLRGGTETYGYNNLQFEKGSTATTYTDFVSQEADIDLTSYNLFDFENNMWFIANNAVGIKQENSIYVKCASSQYGHIRYPNLSLNLKPNTTYTFSARVVSTNTTNGSSVFVSGNLINGGTAVYGNKVTAGGTSYVTFTTPSTITGDMNSAYVGLYPRESDKEATFDQIQITESNTLLPFKEYVETPVEYCKIGNYEDKFVRNSGKNKAYNNIIGKYFYDTGAWASDSKYVTTLANVENGKTYTISQGNASSVYFNRLGQYNGDNVSLTNVTSIATTEGTYTFTSNFDGIVAICWRLTTSVDFQPIEVQVNEGTTALPYEPYGSNEWYIKKNIGKIVLDGSESGLDKATQGFIVLGTSSIFADRNKNVYEGYCNYFGFNDNSTTWTGLYKCGFNSSNVFWVRDDNNVATSLEEWRTWLGTHNVIVVFPLETPTYTQITGTLAEQLENVYKKMMSQKGQTNISQVNNDLAFEMSVSAIEELGG